MTASSTIILFNISKVCRICLMESESARSVYSKLDQNEVLEVNVYSLSAVLERITNIPVAPNDGFPNLICSDCVSLLYGAYKFKIQFDHSLGILQQYVSDYVKNEVTNISDFEFIQSNENDSDSKTVLIQPFKNEQYGKRSTSKQQIQKRQSNTIIEIRQPKKRGRKPKMKFKNEEGNEDNTVETTTNKAVLHPCPVCTKEFAALELREHAHTHKALKKYLSVPLEAKVSSNIKFYRKYDVEKEIISLHSQEEKFHRCVVCNLECSAEILRLHLQSHRNQTEYKCDQCQRVFKKLNHLNTHRVKHLKEYPFKCDQCGKGFVIKRNYECHMLTHNTNQELPHECNYCLKRFSNPEHLNRHMVIHTENVSYSVKYKVCKCHHCLQTFKDRSDLKSHVCVPVEQAVNTRFPCKICNKVFKNSSGLYNHNRNIHKLKGAKVLCSACGNYVSNIYNHMMRHTGEKPFQCNQCGKRFIGKPQLRQHLLVHSGLKPFVCSVCAKAFNNLYNLQVHERIHKGDRCHICPICGKGFLEKSYLKKHMNVHAKLS